MTLKGEKSEDPGKYIKFGMTKYHDYSKISVLGRGTYGEVTRCMHIHSGIEVAMKTFFFDVRTLPCFIYTYRMCKMVSTTLL